MHGPQRGWKLSLPLCWFSSGGPSCGSLQNCWQGAVSRVGALAGSEPHVKGAMTLAEPPRSREGTVPKARLLRVPARAVSQHSLIHRSLRRINRNIKTYTRTNTDADADRDRLHRDRDREQRAEYREQGEANCELSTENKERRTENSEQRRENRDRDRDKDRFRQTHKHTNTSTNKLERHSWACSEYSLYIGLASSTFEWFVKARQNVCCSSSFCLM